MWVDGDMISFLFCRNCKATNQNIKKSPHCFKDHPLRIKIVQRFYFYSLKETVMIVHLELSTPIGLQLDQAAMK